jgi:SAM-dependent methyltransferase
VVQADVYHLPFRARAFDIGYSLGVLHHLPEPEAGFREMASRVKSGGEAFVWVYRRTLRKMLFEPIRRPFTHVAPPLLKRICFVAAVLDYGVCCNLYRVLSRFPGLSRVASLFPNRIKEYATYDFHVSYTDWYDRLSAPIVECYSESDIRGWYERAGLASIRTSVQADFGVRAQGRVA